MSKEPADGGQLMFFLERAIPHLPEDLREEAQEYRDRIHDHGAE